MERVRYCKTAQLSASAYQRSYVTFIVIRVLSGGLFTFEAHYQIDD